jgi:D-psicose/D-tagatose/L-ribulose 3-epimerase
MMPSGMKLGVNSFIWSATFGSAQLPLLPKIKSWGFDGVEVPIFRPREFAAAEIRAGVEAHDLECTVCSVLVQGFSLISEDAGVRRATLTHMQDVIRAAADAGTKVLAGPL